MDSKYNSIIAQVGDISLLRAENKALSILLSALLPMAAVRTDEDKKLCEVRKLESLNIGLLIKRITCNL